MKTIALVLAMMIAGILLAACGEIAPNEVQPLCSELYESLLQEHPDYPQAFIGACVSYYQTGNTNAFASLCKYEPFLEDIGVDTAKECREYIKNFKE